MRFELLMSERLPPMGWLARKSRGSNETKVWHGQQVSIEKDIFWEGINPVPDGPVDVIHHHFPLCSGGAIVGEDLVFFTPGHSLDRIFGFRDEGLFWLSNSLPLILAATGQKLNDRYMFYPWEFETIDRHDRCLSLEDGKQLHIFYNCNIHIDPQLNHQTNYRPTEFVFDNFETYSGALKNFVEGIGAVNGHRSNRYFAPLSSLSRGYDSTAVTVLARMCGTQEVLSIRDARGSEIGAEDVTKTAELLGMRTHSTARNSYRQYGIDAEKIFYLTALAEDICFYPFLDALRGRLLFCGYHGDTMWDRGAYPVGTWRRENTGASMQEFRIRTGYVLLPLAFFGWQHHTDIIRLSRSDEMRKWSVGGSYDRPIPRRIAEEAGIPRKWFGTKKMAVTVSAGQLREDDEVSPELQQLLEKHWEKISTPLFRLKQTSINFANHTILLAQALYGSSSRQSSIMPMSPESQTRISGMISKVRTTVKYSQLRRKYIRPVKPISFAAQVTNRLVVSEYKELFD